MQGVFECNKRRILPEMLSALGPQVALVRYPWPEALSNLTIQEHLTFAAELSHPKSLPNRHGVMMAVINCCLHAFHLYRSVFGGSG